MSAIEVHGLTRRFGDFTAVDDVSFAVDEGEIFGFLGPNGAGKTTTIRMLTGLLRPTAGAAVVAGRELGGDTAALRQRIGYMSQSFSLYGDLTVDENIELFGGLYDVTGARLEERRAWVLRMAGLEDRGRRLTAELPLGFKQRLALGCAVLHEPPILFLDEPTSGVDPVARRAFWDLIYALAAGTRADSSAASHDGPDPGRARDGESTDSWHGERTRRTTVLVSTHYMEEAEYCHRLILMNRGRLIAQGTPPALRGAMTDPIFELETSDPAAAVAALAEHPAVVDAALFGRAVHVVVRHADEAMQVIPGVFGARGLQLAGMRRVEPSLEDVFVSLVRREGGAVVG